MILFLCVLYWYVRETNMPDELRANMDVVCRFGRDRDEFLANGVGGLGRPR